MPSFNPPYDLDLDIRRVELEIAQLELDHRAAKRHVDYFYNGVLVGYCRQSPEMNTAWSSRNGVNYDQDSRIRSYHARNDGGHDYRRSYQPFPSSPRRKLTRDDQFGTQHRRCSYGNDSGYAPRYSRTSNDFNVVFREPMETRRSRSRTSRPRTRIDEQGRVVRLPDEIEEMSDSDKPRVRGARPRMKLLMASGED